MNPVLRREILQIYADAEREVAAAGPVCVASGRCCRFKEWGHTLFLSSIEADLLITEAPAYEQPVSEDFCPFQKEKLCTAREPRPLGCRVYFCDPNYQTRSHEITEKYVRRLKDLAATHDIAWHYAPLHHFLNQPQEASSTK